MFRTFARLFLPNRLDWLCRKRPRAVLLAWNRGLGDIPLGLYAIVHRIKTFNPSAVVTCLTRENLKEPFSLFPAVETLIAPDWERGMPYDVPKTLDLLGRSTREFDLVIPYPKPADWVRWQYGSLTPTLRWNSEEDARYKRFALPRDAIGVHVHAETNYAAWRNWPEERLREFFVLARESPIILFGLRKTPPFYGQNIIDLRGVTSFLDTLSVIKNCCRVLVAPDSGILSSVYYLDCSFPVRVCSLWAEGNHGVLKQRVPSPNPQLVHIPFVASRRDLSMISAEEVFARCLG